MLQSPFAFFRGAAAIMAADLAGEVRTGTELVVCGDAHLANFGLHASPDRRVLFDVNDFDETAFGPWEWDVKRLAASAVVAGRHLGFTDTVSREAATRAVRAYRRSLQRLFTWLTVDGRDYYCRQFRDMKGSIELEGLSPAQLVQYSALCGAVIARSHAQSPDAGVVSGYLGGSDRFDEAIADWAAAYADQTERDFAALEAAVADGHMPAELGV